jgi:hypothetical protein
VVECGHVWRIPDDYEVLRVVESGKEVVESGKEVVESGRRRAPFPATTAEFAETGRNEEDWNPLGARLYHKSDYIVNYIRRPTCRAVGVEMRRAK